MANDLWLFEWVALLMIITGVMWPFEWGAVLFVNLWRTRQQIRRPLAPNGIHSLQVGTQSGSLNGHL